jgi:hypothetical protein
MMRKRAGKKLSLNRETVRELGAELGGARGGADDLFGSRFLCGSRRCPKPETWTQTVVVDLCYPVPEPQ